MATNSVLKSHHGTLSAATEDIVKLTQYWDQIEVENKDASAVMYVRLDGTAATVAGSGTEFIGAGKSKVFKAAIKATGSAVTTPHHISLISAGTPGYAVTGIAGTD